MAWLALGIAAAGVLLLLPVAACMVASGRITKDEKGRGRDGGKG